jgi:hypothetical protein
MSKIKKWFDDRYLEPFDFIPFYGPLVRRDRRLKGLGVETTDFFQHGKLKQGSNILNIYNYATVFGAGFATRYLLF